MIRAVLTLPIRAVVWLVGIYIDRAVRRLHELDSEEQP
jgi:hypothetical protein